MEKPVTFSGKEYTLASLKAMSVDELLTLRNLVAENLGAARVNAFKDHDAAVTAAAAALKKYGDTVAAENADAGSGDAGADGKKAKAPKEPKAPKPPKEKTERPTPKCYSAEVVKRPSRRMFGRIKKIGLPGKDQRPFAWDWFSDGQRLIDIKEDPKLHAGKISFWMRQEPPLIELVQVTDAEYEKELAEWYAKHGFQNPNASKEAKEKEKAEAQAKRDELKAKKAAEKEAAAKAKAEEAAKKAAEKEAAAKAKAEAAAKAKADAAAKAKADKTAAPAQA